LRRMKRSRCVNRDWFEKICRKVLPVSINNRCPMVITNTPTIAYCSKPHRNPLSILIIIFIFLFSHCSSLLLINLPSELAETIFCFSLYSYEAGPVFFFSDLLRIHCYISCRTLLFWLATVPVKGHWRLRFGQNHGRNARKKLTAWN